MFMINALLLFFTSAFLMSVIDRIDRGVFFLSLIFCHFLVVTLTRGALAIGWSFLYPLLFSYAYVSKIMLFLIFWTMANDLTDSRKAAGVFPIIAAGGTTGAIGASFAIPLFMKIIPAENLLVVWSAALFVLGIIFMLFRGSFGKELRPHPRHRTHADRGLARLRQDLMLVRGEPLLRTMAIVYFLLFFILINQQYTFYAHLKIHLVNAKALASFLGFFNGCSMFATLTLQTTVAGRILKKIGSTRSMLFLPAVLCLVFFCLTCLGLFPGLMGGKAAGGGAGIVIFWSVVFGMGLRAAFFDSFFSPNFQVFFSSLSKDIRGRGKLFIEGAVKPAAIISASLWLQFAVPKVPVGWSMLALCLLSAAMIIHALRLRKRYTESLILSLTGTRSKRAIQIFSFVDLAHEENFLTALSRALEKEDYEIKKYVIGILTDIGSAESIAVLSEHLEVCDDYTRSMIISALTPLKRDELGEVYFRSLKSGDRRVVANAILALAALQNGGIEERLVGFLYHPDNRVRANAIMVLWPRWSDEKRKVLGRILYDMLFSGDPFHGASALYAIGTLRAREFLPELAAFAGQSAQRIAGNDMLWKNYLAAVTGIGGEGSLEMLFALGRPASEKRSKSLIAAVSGLLDGGYPLDEFFEKLSEVDYLKRAIMLAALEKRKAAARRYHGWEARLRGLALEEIKETYRDWAALAILDGGELPKQLQLLRLSVLEERIGKRLASVVAVASILDGSGQIGLVAPRLHHSNRHIRAQAMEVFDNSGDLKVNRWILRLLETDDPSAHAKTASSGFQIGPPPLPDTIGLYAGDPCDWIRECSAYAAANLYYRTRDPRWLDAPDVAKKGFNPR
jgi:AAA family ATP:ADP antiporter